MATRLRLRNREATEHNWNGIAGFATNPGWLGYIPAGRKVVS